MKKILFLLVFIQVIGLTISSCTFKTNHSSSDFLEQQLLLSQNGNYVTWDSIDNADYYEIYIDDVFLKKVSSPSFYLYDAKKFDYKLTVTAVDNDSSLSLSSNIDITITDDVLVLDPTKIHNNISYEFNENNKAYILYTPPYNAYIKIRSNLGSISNVWENGKLIDIINYYLFAAGNEYTIELLRNGAISDSGPLMTFIYKPYESGVTMSVPSGTTVYSTSPTVFTKWECFDTTNDDLSFAYTDEINGQEIDFSSLVFYPQYIDKQSYGYIAVKNDSSTSQVINLSLSSIQLEASGTIEIPPGYSNLTLTIFNYGQYPSWVKNIGFYTSEQLWLYYGNESQQGNMIISKSNGDLGVYMYEFFISPNVVVFNPSSNNVNLEYGIVSNSVNTQGLNNFTLPFGYSGIFTSSNKKLTFSKPVYYKGNYSDVANLKSSYSNPHMIFNPWKEDLSVVVNLS